MTRTTDYYRGGAEGLWILDARVGVFEVYERASSSWSTLTVLTQQSDFAQLALPGGGEVTVQLGAILR